MKSAQHVNGTRCVSFDEMTAIVSETVRQLPIDSAMSQRV